MKLQKQHLLENIIYTAIWLIVFFLPLVGDYFSLSSDKWSIRNWEMIGRLWLTILPLFLIFIVNNNFLVPRLLFYKKYVGYTISVICSVLLILWIFFLPYNLFPHKPFEEIEKMEPIRDWQNMTPMNRETIKKGFLDAKPTPKKPPEEFMRGKPRFFPNMILEIFYGRFLVAILVIGFNIAIKLLFKSLRDEEVMKELERHSLQSELEYLKYQINPHFFMNTLNNIHALVDVDSEKAKKTIVELSKMMRYLLYESDNKAIPLAKEVLFLNNYIGLMRLRYTEKVDIEISMPTEIPAVKIPPLLFISFVENAFKHGVSYLSNSFIHVCMRLEGGQLLFQCSNSNLEQNEGKQGGIGLENIRKRLNLLFGETYVLSIEQFSDSFDVLLIIPITYD